jgi:hypothetical protein
VLDSALSEAAPDGVVGPSEEAEEGFCGREKDRSFLCRRLDEDERASLIWQFMRTIILVCYNIHLTFSLIRKFLDLNFCLVFSQPISGCLTLSDTFEIYTYD